MRQVTTTTTAAGREYSLAYMEFISLDEALETVEGGEEAILGIVNASQRQNAMQGGKSDVVKAIEAEDATEESILAAIQKHVASALGYVIGRPRGGSGGGPTKKSKENLGDRILAHVQEHGKQPTQKELAEIMEDLGL